MYVALNCEVGRTIARCTPQFSATYRKELLTLIKRNIYSFNILKYSELQATYSHKKQKALRSKFQVPFFITYSGHIPNDLKQKPSFY